MGSTPRPQHLRRGRSRATTYAKLNQAPLPKESALRLFRHAVTRVRSDADFFTVTGATVTADTGYHPDCDVGVDVANLVGAVRAIRAKPRRDSFSHVENRIGDEPRMRLESVSAFRRSRCPFPMQSRFEPRSFRRIAPRMPPLQITASGRSCSR